MPQNWKDPKLCPSSKGTAVRTCSNYRGISLLSIARKVMGYIILNRINDRITPNILRYSVVFGLTEAPLTWSSVFRRIKISLPKQTRSCTLYA